MSVSIHHLVATAIAVGMLPLTTRAQGPPLQVAEQEPRFLSAPSGNAPAVDVSNSPVFARRVTLEFDRVPLGAALRAVGDRAQIRLLFSATEVPVERPVSVSARNITLGGALHELLWGTGLDVRLSPTGLVAIVPRAPSNPRAAAQPGASTLRGRIVDGASGTPIDRVSVQVDGEGPGTVSGADGRYVVRNVPAGTHRVIARRVGYTPVATTVVVGADSTAVVDFTLVAAPTKLDEIVTTAVGKQRRYEVGNVISSINAESIAVAAPITSVTDLISARAPGVQVLETGGLTGSGETIRIRGLSSLVLQGDPIVLIDGVRQDNGAGGAVTVAPVVNGLSSVPAPSRLNDLDFDDIATIDVLKGPAASTEYGTDAANGVVVITTKHGSAGRPRWTASAERTTSEIPERFPSLYYRFGHTTDGSNTPVQCPLIGYIFGAGVGSATGTCAVDSVSNFDPLNDPRYTIFGTGEREKYDLSVSGGTDAVRYYVSGGLWNENGPLQLPSGFQSEATTLGLPRSQFQPNGENQRTLRANTSVRLSPTADLDVSGAYMSTYQRTPNAQFLYQGIVFSPPLRDSANNFGYSSSGFENPVYQFGLPNSQASDRLTGALTATWRPWSWLSGHAAIGLDHGSREDRSEAMPQVTPLFIFFPAQLGIEDGTTDIYTVDVRGSATADLTRTLRAVTSVGTQLVDTRTQATVATATGITASNETLNGATAPTVAQIGDRQATLGGYVEEQLDLSDRLFVTGALRVDAGSGFGSAYRTAVYPKASISWLALQGSSTTLRLRSAFGASGVQPPNGSALQLYAPTVSWLNGAPVPTVGILNAENPHLQPERSLEYEAGADVGLWDNRITLELTGYSKTTQNALVSTGTGWELGAFAFEENVGRVRNTGVEGSATATVLRGRSVTWDVSLNASVNHNKLVSLAPGVLSQTVTGAKAVYRFTPGFPLYGYWAPRVHFADTNGDGVIEPGEVTIADSASFVGSSLPTQEASLGSHLAVLGGAVSIGALIDYRGGFRLMNTTAFNAATGAQSDRASNFSTAPLAEQARDVAAELITQTGLGSAAPAGFFEDATYVRFRELSLTYAVPSRIVRALHTHSLGITAAVRNLALWTRYGGVDPEASSTQGANLQFNPTSNTFTVNNNLREDAQAIPLLRYWVLRLNLGL